MAKKIRVEGFVKQSTPAFNVGTCYFVASKDRKYYLITVKMYDESYSALPLDISFEGHERQRNSSLQFNEKGFLEFKCKSGFYLLDLNGKVSRCSEDRRGLSEGDNGYRIKITAGDEEIYHFENDELLSTTACYSDVTVLQYDEEVLKIRFDQFDFEDASIYGVIDENIILKCYRATGTFYLICNKREKVIHACYYSQKPIFENYRILTEEWKKENGYEEFHGASFSFDKKCIVYWGKEGRLRYQPLSDVGYVPEKGNSSTRYSEILCMENNLEVYKSGWDDGYYYYRIRVKLIDEWKESSFKLGESWELYIHARESVYVLKEHRVGILVSKYFYENILIEFDVPSKGTGVCTEVDIDEM